MVDTEEPVSAFSNLDMAYGRRNFVAYHRGGIAGSIVAPSRSLASYRNKIAAILGITVLYTAFLYRSGTNCQMKLELPWFLCDARSLVV